MEENLENLDLPKKYNIKRNASGKFAPGTGGGPGRKAGSTLGRLTVRWEKQCKEKHVDKVYYALLNECLKGNVAAIKIYLDRALGKVKENVNITNVNITETENPETLRQKFHELFSRNN